MGLEMGKIFRGDVSVLEDDSPVWSKELTLVVPCLEKHPFEGLCRDI